MKDGSGNPFMWWNGIKDYNVQPDAAAKEWKPGHAQKKSLFEFYSKRDFLTILTWHQKLISWLLDLDI